MIRFRAGKFRDSGSTPKAYSEMTAPPFSTTCRNRALFFPGISPVQAVGSDDDGAPLPLQGAPVGPRVDAPGTAADDGKALGRQFGSQ